MRFIYVRQSSRVRKKNAALGAGITQLVSNKDELDDAITQGNCEVALLHVFCMTSRNTRNETNEKCPF